MKFKFSVRKLVEGSHSELVYACETMEQAVTYCKILYDTKPGGYFVAWEKE